jgi:hypothetical protein
MKLHTVSRKIFTRTNLLLETSKIVELRKALGSASNSAAVRRAIEERLAIESGLKALRDLRREGGLEDRFGRVPVSGGIKGSHFRRDSRMPAVARLVSGRTSPHAAGVGDRSHRICFALALISAQPTLPRHQQELQY